MNKATRKVIAGLSQSTPDGLPSYLPRSESLFAASQVVQKAKQYPKHVREEETIRCLAIGILHELSAAQGQIERNVDCELVAQWLYIGVQLYFQCPQLLSALCQREGVSVYPGLCCLPLPPKADVLFAQLAEVFPRDAAAQFYFKGVL